ncbi:hypothetical protein IJG28_03100 [Candidatus Saccharibacteria bacterium]|nr:hypothetical protein [Candidatus Saccharibacteria bacterium]
MNKDVIYIEPEDDITDIILKIENSKEKIVALVPPKKAGVFRSVVNIKLIAKAGVSSEKSVVLVTMDPSIVKLAAATKLPVAKNLQSAPVVPTVDANMESDEAEEEELVEEEDGTVETEEDIDELNPSKSEKELTKQAEEEIEEAEEEADEEEEKPIKKKPNKKKKKFNLISWVKSHKKLAILAGVLGVGIIILLIWMLFIAPAVDITVSIKTDKQNFSENVTFTDKLEDENAEEGKFYLEQKKVEETQKIEFDATGKKNRGNKAIGTLKVSAYFSGTGSIAINAGTHFTYNGLVYTANDYHGLTWDGDEDKCENSKKIFANPDGTMSIRCLISDTVSVTAAEGGSKYNIAASSSGWSTLSGADVVSTTAMEGGTDDEITVVQQSDIINAENQVKSSKEEENKQKLFDTIDDKYYIIESSFEQTISNTAATPAADEEVKDGVKPSIEVTTTASVYVIDKVKLEEFIKHKINLDDDQEIYDIKDIYIENMNNITAGSMTKLKAQYFVGPKLTESELVDKIKGRGLGDARREISDIYGVSDVTIQQSYPWVMAVPNDSNKVTVRFEIKDQDGNSIEDKNENSDDAEDDDEESKNTEEKSES